jgi:hypothetical protein
MESFTEPYRSTRISAIAVPPRLGEPTMQRDDYFAMICYAREKHIWVRTTTDASLLHLKDNYRATIDADVNELQISVAAPAKKFTKAFAAAPITSASWPISRCQLLRARTRCRPHQDVDGGAARNLHELESLVDHAVDVGFSNQVLSLELTDFGLAHRHGINAAASAEQSLDIDSLLGLV